MPALTAIADPLLRALPTSRFQPLAVTATEGPHVTLQAGVTHAGRYWTTTSRRSLKARRLRHRHSAGVFVATGDGAGTVMSGPVTVFDPLRPLTALADPVGLAGSGLALARLLSAQVTQVVGYMEAAGRVPVGWLPTHRVLLSLQASHCLELDGMAVVGARGAWDRPPFQLVVEDRASAPDVDTDALPPSLRALADHRHERAWLGVMTPEGPAVLPAKWEPAGACVAVSAAALGRLLPALPGPVCVTIDEHGSRRPDEKEGVMLRGPGHLVDLDGPVARLRLDAERMTYWEGFEAATVAA